MQDSDCIRREDYLRLSALTEDLGNPNLDIYWFDFSVTAITAWSSFFVAMTSPNFSPLQLAAVLVASLAFYKGVNFIHEISHHPRALSRLSVAYNVFFGSYTRVLSYFGNAHSDHHSAKSFGTQQDPEYENWSRRHPANVFRPVIAAFISPVLMLVRVGVVPLLCVIAGRGFLEIVIRKYSSIVMNFSYRFEKIDHETLVQVRRLDLTVMSLSWMIAGVVIVMGCAWKFALIQYSTLVIANMLGSFRALGVHRYMSDFKRQPAQSQFFDSVSVSETLFSSLWGPLNSNYHSIHHLLPHLPYHSMREANVRLLQDERWKGLYLRTLEKSLLTSLRQLYSRAAAHHRNPAQ